MELCATEYDSLDQLAIRQHAHLRYSEPLDRIELRTLAAATPSTGSAVLDVGPGTASFLREVRAQGHAGRAVGVDTSAAATAAVRTVAGVRAVRGDACALPFRAASFDVVFARHMLYHVLDLGRALREFRRVLPPDGRLVAVVNQPAQAPRLSGLLHRLLAEHGVASPVLPRVDSATLPDPLRAVFREVRVERVDGHLVFPAPDPLIRFGTALLGFYGVPPGSAVRPDVERAFADSVVRWFATTGGPWRDPKGYAIFVCRSRR